MMKLIVFAVEQGQCVYVRTPGDYGILVDCGKPGSGGAASPAAWLAEREVPTLQRRNGSSAVSLVVTHPHESHVAGIEDVVRLLSPTPLGCQTDLDWAALIGPATDSNKNLRAYHSWLTSREQQRSVPDLGAKVQQFALSQEEAGPLGECAINNRSVVTIISYISDEGYAWKVVIGGDNRTEAWELLCAKPEFREAIRETDFFITSLHGEEPGYSAELFEAMGKPLANISCSRKSRHTADQKYRKNAQGVKFPDGKRTHIITPDDGNVTVEMQDGGNYDVWLFRPE